MNCEIYNLIVDSDFSLTGLALSGVSKNKILIRSATPSETFQTPPEWFMQWHLPGGRLWLSFAKLDGGYLLRFDELADFFVSSGGESILYKSELGIPPNTIRHLLLDQVIPLVINLRGEEALHASAVLTKAGVIAFSGNTGAGKSTVAGSFLQAGRSVFSDDCLVLLERQKGIYAVPAYPGLRLWADAATWLFGGNNHYKAVAHYTDKKQIDIEMKKEMFCAECRPLKSLYVIDDLAEAEGKIGIVIEPLSPRDSLMALVRCAFRLDITDRNMLTRQFHFLERVASKVSVRRLIYPRDFNFLPAVREAILTDLQGLDN